MVGKVRNVPPWHLLLLFCCSWVLRSTRSNALLLVMVLVRLVCSLG